jgi:hypothetical protein
VSASQRSIIDERKAIAKKLDFYRNLAAALFREGIGTPDDLVDYEHYTFSSTDLGISIDEARSF